MTMIVRLARHAIAAVLAAAVLAGCDDPRMRIETLGGSFGDVGLVVSPEFVQGSRTTFGHRRLLLVEIRGNGMVRTARPEPGSVEAYDYRTEKTSQIPDLPVILHCDRATLRTEAGAVLKAVPAASTCNGPVRMQSGSRRDVPAYLAFEIPKLTDRVVINFALPVEVVAPEEDEWQAARERIGLWDDATFEIVRRKMVPPLLGTRQAVAKLVALPIP
jgi:hypothetical protein